MDNYRFLRVWLFVLVLVISATLLFGSICQAQGLTDRRQDSWSIIFILFFGIAALVPAIWAIIGVIQGNQKYWPAVAGVCWAVVLMGVFFIGMAKDWGGCDEKNAKDVVWCEKAENCSKVDPWGDKCNTRCPGVPEGAYCPDNERPVFKFCEKFDDGKIKQPWSTWSDLAFIAAGIWILWCFRFFKKTSLSNPMQRIGWLSVAYGMIVIFMGPPSMLLHASMKKWGGLLDSMSVVMWLSFNAAYVLYLCLMTTFDIRGGKTRTLVVLLLAAVLVLLFGLLDGYEVQKASLAGYLTTGIIWGICEAWFFLRYYLSKSAKYRRTFWIFGVNFGILGLTMGIWILYNASVVNAATCQAFESFPGHAFFHILASIATFSTFLSFATEKRVVRGS